MRLVPAITALIALLPAQIRCSRLEPPVLPLVVRNPYLSTWLANARDVPWKSWPMFWTGQEVGMSVMAKVGSEGAVYPLLGRPQDSLDTSGDHEGYKVVYPHYKGVKYDASTTNLSYSLPLSDKGLLAEVFLSFISPITPASTLAQSYPASYVKVYVQSNVNVDIYMDLNGQWVSGDRGVEIEWDLDQISLSKDPSNDTHLLSWSVRRKDEGVFQEYLDRAEWGTLHFIAPSDTRYESGVSEKVRKQFAEKGTLRNRRDTDFRSIMDAEPVFAFAKTFEAEEIVQLQSVLLTIAHVQDPVIHFAAERGLTEMRPLWRTVHTTEEMLAYHYTQFASHTRQAYKYSVQLAADAFKSGAEDYVDIVALSARQVMGATVFAGTPKNPILFMKEISSDGNLQTVDVIFPAFPFFLYTNPQWLAYLLEPLLEHMRSGQYPRDYTMHDLGTHYPNATGHPDGNDEYMPVEECGNMLIMALALANSLKYDSKTISNSQWTPMIDVSQPDSHPDSALPLVLGQDGEDTYVDQPWTGNAQNIAAAREWVNQSYTLFGQWNKYLVDYSLRPANQLSTDDFAGWLALQTNLALKGIIGIKAMAGLAEIVGAKEDVKNYTATAEYYISKWEEYGISRDKTHAKVAYDWYGSWTTTYNLFADSLLCFHLGSNAKTEDTQHGSDTQTPIKGDKDGFVPKHIYQMQSDWYYNVRQKYGLPLDSRHLYTKTDWEFWAMAVAAPGVRAKILESVAFWINETVTDRPLTDLHNTEGRGEFPGPDFFARPVVGGHFAFLALERACGGKAMDGLKFLNDSVTKGDKKLDVAEILRLEIEAEKVLIPQEL